MMDWYHGGAGSTAWIMWMTMGLFWLGLIALVVFLVIRLLPASGASRAAAPAPQNPTGSFESPEQILDRLFALGEIDEQTYRTRRSALAEMRRSS